MSVIDQINKLLGKSAPPAPVDAEAPVGNGGPGDGEINESPVAAGESAQFSTAQFPDSKLVGGIVLGDEAASGEKTDLLTLPVLGSRTSAQHQRILAVLLGLALVILTAVTFFALNQADRVAQQVATTGQAHSMASKME